jgi:hypothetical protein
MRIPSNSFPFFSVSAFFALTACEAPKMTVPSTAAGASQLSQSSGTAAGGCRIETVAGGANISCGADTVFISNGTNGTAGAAGTNGTNGATGATGATGPAGPRGLAGPAGSGAGHEFWLTYHDGTPIAQVVSFMDGLNLWDDVNHVAIYYQVGSRHTTYKASAVNSFYLYYATSDCSGQAYSSATAAGHFGALPGTAVVLGGNLYRVDPTFSSPAVVAKKTENPDGTLSACQAYTLGSGETGARPKVTQITPTFPLEFAVNDIKIVRQ